MRLFFDLLFSFWGFVVLFYSAIFGFIVWMFWPWTIILLILGAAFIGFAIHVIKGAIEVKQEHMKHVGWDK
jgi:hypothetical protein